LIRQYIILIFESSVKERFPYSTQRNRSLFAEGFRLNKGLCKNSQSVVIQYFENNDIELYNLKDDISEKNNMVKSNIKEANELVELLNKWRKETNAPIPSDLNPEFSP